MNWKKTERSRTQATLPPGWYVSRTELSEKEFFKRFQRAIPHSDQLPKVYHNWPVGNLKLGVPAMFIDYPDFAIKTEKLLKRLRDRCEWVAVWSAFSSLYWVNLMEWQAAKNPWPENVGFHNHFENMYAVAENCTFGIAVIVHGNEVVLFGEPLVTLASTLKFNIQTIK